jgi:hypothetical protein
LSNRKASGVASNDSRRAFNFNAGEIEVLVDCALRYRLALRSVSLTDGNRSKADAWEKIANAVNAMNPDLSPRSISALQQKLSNLISDAKRKAASMGVSRGKTGGGAAATDSELSELQRKLLAYAGPDVLGVKGGQAIGISDSQLEIINVPQSPQSLTVSAIVSTNSTYV